MRDAGAEKEFHRFYEKHVAAIKRYTLRQFNDYKLIDDVIAETFTVVWKRWETRPSRELELQWLYGIAWRVISNHRRSRNRRRSLASRLAFDRTHATNANDIDSLHATSIRELLRRLKPSDQRMLELVYWEKLSYREIAKVIGISENAVGIRINRAKKNLRLLIPDSMKIERGEGLPNGDGS